MKHGWSRLPLFLASVAVLAACGRQSELESGNILALQAALVSQTGSSAAIANPQFQAELQGVMSEVNNAVATAVLPGYTPRSLGTTAAVSCAPKFNIVLVGVAVTFTPGAGCVLSGTIDVKLFPTTVNVNLSTVGLKFIDKVQLTGSVVLGGNTSMQFSFLNGRIDIKQVAGIALGGITFNGQANLSTAPRFKLKSRINAFAATASVGVALMANIDDSIGLSQIQGCLLSGGNGNDPNAGLAAPCFGI